MNITSYYWSAGTVKVTQLISVSKNSSDFFHCFHIRSSRRGKEEGKERKMEGRKEGRKGGRTERERIHLVLWQKSITSSFVALDLWQYTCKAWSWGIGLKSIEESVRNISYLHWEKELCLHYKTSKNRINKNSWKTSVRKYTWCPVS